MTFMLHLENVVTTWTLLKEVSWHVTVILIYIYIGLRQSEDKWTMSIFMSLLSSDFFQHMSKCTVKWYKSSKIFFMWWQADFFHQLKKCPPPLPPPRFWRHCTGRLLDITHMCYEYTTPFSLANSDNTDKMTWVWPSTLQSVNRCVIMNIHVACTPPVRTALRHTCCQGQTSGLTVRPDATRWVIHFWMTSFF